MTASLAAEASRPIYTARVNIARRSRAGFGSTHKSALRTGVRLMTFVTKPPGGA